MIWQEYVLTFIGFAFTAALAPLIMGWKFKLSGYLTASLLWLLAGTMATLGFWTAAIANVSTALAWTYIAIMKKA